MRAEFPRHAARIAAGLAFAASSVVLASSAFAAEPFAAPKAAESAPASAGSLAQVTLSLMLVLAAVFAAAWVVRRLRNFGRVGAGAIEIVADVALGTKERAVLVQVGNQQLLLGVAPGRVNTLHVLAEPVQVGRSPLSNPSSPGDIAGQGADARPDFKAILKRSLGL
jgi:flagellar protein FliO/FliZ